MSFFIITRYMEQTKTTSSQISIFPHHFLIIDLKLHQILVLHFNIHLFIPLAIPTRIRFRLKLCPLLPTNNLNIRICLIKVSRMVFLQPDFKTFHHQSPTIQFILYLANSTRNCISPLFLVLQRILGCIIAQLHIMKLIFYFVRLLLKFLITLNNMFLLFPKTMNLTYNILKFLIIIYNVLFFHMLLLMHLFPFIF